MNKLYLWLYSPNTHIFHFTLPITSLSFLSNTIELPWNKHPIYPLSQARGWVTHHPTRWARQATCSPPQLSCHIHHSRIQASAKDHEGGPRRSSSKHQVHLSSPSKLGGLTTRCCHWSQSCPHHESLFAISSLRA